MTDDTADITRSTVREDGMHIVRQIAVRERHSDFHGTHTSREVGVITGQIIEALDSLEGINTSAIDDSDSRAGIVDAHHRLEAIVGLLEVDTE